MIYVSQDIIYIFENTINKSNFILSIKLSGGKLFQKIPFFIQTMIEGVRETGDECYIEIIGHCEYFKQQSKNQNQSCILANEKASVCYPCDFDNLISFKSDKIYCFTFCNSYS